MSGHLTDAVQHTPLTITFFLLHGAMPAILHWFHLLKCATLDFLEITKGGDLYLHDRIVLLMVLAFQSIRRP